VLVGGLGLGFTAAALLADARVQRVDVVELEGAVVGWLRDGTVPHGPALLADARLHVVEDDVAHVVQRAAPAAYDLVLLDVDNGPEYLVHDANARVYRAPFLQRCRDALVPGGVLAVWAANEAPALTDAVAAVFGDCEVARVPVRLQGRDEEYLLYLGSAR
jgi:spermidine synthase